jgi:hypothetical protein
MSTTMSTTAVGPRQAGAAAPINSGAWRPGSRRTWWATAHLMLDLPVGMMWGTLVSALVAASVGLVPLALLGVAGRVLTLAGSLLVARLERARARLLLGTTNAAPKPLPRTAGGCLRLLIDARAWLSCLYAVLLMPLGLINATVTVTGWALVAAGATSQLWAWLLPAETLTIGSSSLTGEPVVLLVTLVALLLGTAMPFVIRFLAAVDGWLVRTLLR